MQSLYSDTNAGLHYDLNLEIDPQAETIQVSGSLAYHSPQPRLERARFSLHRQMNIRRLEGRRVLGYHFEIASQPGETQPSTGTLDIYFDPPLSNGETTLIQFEYSGAVTGLDLPESCAMGADWVELNRELSWFPYQQASAGLTYTLTVGCPAGYQPASSGPAEFQRGRWAFNWPHPTDDIVVAAGPGLESLALASPPNHFILHATALQGTEAGLLGEDMLWVLERYAGWFGPTRPADFTVIASQRPSGGWYTRRGLAVLNQLGPEQYQQHRWQTLHYLARAAAQAWWWEAPGDQWEAWLNDSFAEYAALLAVRERFGAGVFEQILAGKRERDPAGQALWQFPYDNGAGSPGADHSQRMLYDKGPLLLHALEERIGHSRFLSLCRAMLWSGVMDSSHLLALLEEVEDAGQRAWFEQALKGALG